MTLTNTEIIKAKVKEKPYKLFDSDGLFLLVNPSGSKIWRFKYYFAGKENQISFGKYDEVTLADAREKRLNARKLLSNGIDPSGKKREERQLAIYKSENTFQVIAKQWFETNKSKWTDKHGEKLFKRLENHIFIYFGNRAVDTIKPLEVLGVIKKVEGKGKIDTAHRLLQYCNAVFKYAIITGRTENNPAGSLSGALKPKKPEHYRTIKAGELKDFLEKLEVVPTSLQNKIAVKLLLLTFLRTGELRQTKWEHIDFEAGEWRVPEEVMKMKHPHISAT